MKFTETLVVPGVRIDTTLALGRLDTPFSYRKERLSLNLHRRHDSLALSSACRPDTLYITREIPVERIKEVKPSFFSLLLAKLPWLITGIMLILVLIIFLRTIRSP